MSRCISLCFAGCALLLCAALPARAADMHVPAEFSTIQAAIDAASPGDVILVSPGTYLENLDYHGKDVMVRGTDGARFTILRRADEWATVAVSIGPGGGLVGFSIQGGMTAVYGEGSIITDNRFLPATIGDFPNALFAYDASPILERNLFIASTWYGDCAVFWGNSSPRVANNVFEDVGVGIDMFVTSESTPVVINNTFMRCSEAIHVYPQGNYVTLQTYRNNLFFSNNAAFWIDPNSVPGDLPVFDHNLMYNNNYDYYEMPDLTGIDGNLHADPLFGAGSARGYLPPGSPAIDAGNSDLAPSEDLDNAPRPLDGNGDSVPLVDIGAYEFNPEVVANDVTAPTTGLSMIRQWTFLRAIDPGGSGVKDTYVSVDSGGYFSYWGALTLPEGYHHLDFFSIDMANNIETPKSRDIFVDWTAPSTALTLDGWPPTVTLAATDNQPSGALTTYYALNDGHYQLYTGPFTIPVGEYTLVRFFSTDAVGNIENERSEWISGFDTISPTITATAQIQQQGKRKDALVPVNVTGSVFDGQLGVDPNTVTYAVKDEYGKVQPSGRVALFPDGGFEFTLLLQPALSKDRDGRTFTITLKAKDLAGNEGTTEVTVVVMRR